MLIVSTVQVLSLPLVKSDESASVRTRVSLKEESGESRTMVVDLYSVGGQ